jgi:hypothetical protein
MKRTFLRISQPNPWLIGALLIAVSGSAYAAPRGSNAWCEKMMDTPRNAWSINDHVAFDDHCQVQKKRWYQAIEREQSAPIISKEEEDAFMRKLWSEPNTGIPATRPPPLTHLPKDGASYFHKGT